MPAATLAAFTAFATRPVAAAPGLPYLGAMVKQHFSHVSTWVFDLDNTLYPPRYRLFDQIEVRMTAWVMQALNVSQDEASRLRQHYWDHYGTTLAGLMREHGIDPGPYLTDVHDIDFSLLPRDPELAARLRRMLATPAEPERLVERAMVGFLDQIRNGQARFADHKSQNIAESQVEIDYSNFFV